MKVLKLYKENPNILQFIRFCVVGVFCTTLDATIFYLARNIVIYPVALIAGYCISLTVNYLLTIYWTFSSKPSIQNALGIIAAHFFNLFVIRMRLMYLFINILSFSDTTAYVPALLISVVTNFTIMKFIIDRLK